MALATVLIGSLLLPAITSALRSAQTIPSVSESSGEGDGSAAGDDDDDVIADDDDGGFDGGLWTDDVADDPQPLMTIADMSASTDLRVIIFPSLYLYRAGYPIYGAGQESPGCCRYTKCHPLREQIPRLITGGSFIVHSNRRFVFPETIA